MSARDELLATGRLGEEGARQLYRAVQLVARGYAFPPPEDQPRWNDASVQAVAHQFIEGERGQKRLLAIAIGTVDDRTFTRKLEASVRNFMRDQSRATDFGKLVVRVKAVLRQHEDFVEVKHRGSESTWALLGETTQASGVSAADLTAAIRGVAVVIPRWRSEKRDAPLADGASFVRLITAVLVAAEGSLTAVDITHALTTRLDYRKTPLTLDLERDQGLSEAASGDPVSQSLSRMRATEILRLLSDRDRTIVATMELNVRELGEAIGTGKSQAAHLRKQLEDRLAAELAEDDEPEQTVGALVRLCNDWIQDRTEIVDATFQ